MASRKRGKMRARSAVQKSLLTALVSRRVAESECDMREGNLSCFSLTEHGMSAGAVTAVAMG